MKTVPTDYDQQCKLKYTISDAVPNRIQFNVRFGFLIN